MSERLDVAVVGAGPFGLSVAAHLSPGRRVRTFGRPMETWRERMPPDMLLRSAWEETSLSAPGGRGTIDEWAEDEGEAREEPIPLAKFLRYSEWFHARFAPENDPAQVTLVEPVDDRFRLETGAGGVVEARSVVLAVGVTPFPYAPEAFQGAMGGAIRFSIDPLDAAGFEGKRVLVVGGGQGGLESAALAAGAGAEVELVVRSEVRWFADREAHHPRGRLAQRLYRLAYPAVGYGPPILNRLALAPDLLAALPRDVRRRITGRALRPGGSPWIREVAEGRVKVTEGVSVEEVESKENPVRVRLTDGTRREADAVLVSTGYRFSLERLTFLSEDLRRRIRIEHGWPVLDRYFRSTDPRVMFVGYPAEGRFGPLSRFVLGTEFTATRVARHLRP